MLYGMHGPSALTPGVGDDGARRLIGVDAGKVTTSLAWGRTGDDGSLTVEGTSAVRHLGEPLAPFFSLYRSLGPARVAGVVAAGAFGDRLTTPALAGIPEEIAQEWAVRTLYGDEGALNVVRIGGSGYSVLTRDAAGRIGYETNERCSAGTGETVEGLCGRLGCGLDEAVSLAAAADRGISVTSRCAVFAKSELTHFANQGEDHGRLFRGLFESVARNVHALYDRAKVDGPVVLVGHGALIGPLVEAFRALVSEPVEVPAEAGVFEALGALRIAAARDWSGLEWPERPETMVVERRGRVRALAPAADGPGSVVQLAVDGDGDHVGADGSRRRRAGARRPNRSPAPRRRSCSVSTWARRARRACWSSPSPAPCWPTCTGAPTATRSRRPSASSPTCARRGRATAWSRSA